MSWIHGALSILGGAAFVALFVSGLHNGGAGYLAVGAVLSFFITDQLRRQFRIDHPDRDADRWGP